MLRVLLTEKHRRRSLRCLSLIIPETEFVLSNLKHFSHGTQDFEVKEANKIKFTMIKLKLNRKIGYFFCDLVKVKSVNSKRLYNFYSFELPHKYIFEQN